MKISALIAALEKVKAEQGDIEVACWPYDGQMNPKPVSELAVNDLRPVRYDQAAGQWKTERVDPRVVLD